MKESNGDGKNFTAKDAKVRDGMVRQLSAVRDGMVQRWAMYAVAGWMEDAMRGLSVRVGMVVLVGLVGCQAPVTQPSATRGTQPSASQGTGEFHTDSRKERREQRRDGQYGSEERGRSRGDGDFGGGGLAGGSPTGQEREQKRGRGGRQAADETPGAFDFYLLTLSWSPEFCVTHPDKSECAAHPGFVLHGLWPQNFAGTFPEDCSNASGPANPAQYKDIYPDAGLLAHEWQTHGTCSGLAPDVFFGDARKAVHEVVVPRELAAVSQPEQLTPDQILGVFAKANPGFAQGSFAVSCGNNRLTAVEICLGKDLKAIACQGVRSCRANVVKVTPQGN